MLASFFVFHLFVHLIKICLCIVLIFCICQKSEHLMSSVFLVCFEWKRSVRYFYYFELIENISSSAYRLSSFSLFYAHKRAMGLAVISTEKKEKKNFFEFPKKVEMTKMSWFKIVFLFLFFSLSLSLSIFSSSSLKYIWNTYQHINRLLITEIVLCFRTNDLMLPECE